ncbi:copper amine oxidase N-terminal domain-containing protein [Paenibacillus sp. BC26]|uniref:copper amine oxidase N-terminal domain-containing protein n=1 Tax=Paenibacillus sp. BC26 TaxID=1881032 RepID=UPI0008E99618|nr:copper amine oxidase N-terminal domain-containing protein [Paenibacillus sp. BC26]SFS76611.1 Copper amine oxidase N-terminal domain-containing protein [Paenibacillus sp. BC26]
MKIYTSRLFLCLILIFVMSPFSSAIAAQTDVYGSVVLNGLTMDLKEKPLVVNGNTMIPFRTIFEALGLSVSWDNKTKKVTGRKQNLDIQLELESKYGIINDNQYLLTQSPFLSSSGTVYVNLRFISEATGANVVWDNKKKLASINTNPRLNALSLQEILDFDLLRDDWSQKQMEELGLKKELYDGGTIYSNEIVTYKFYNDALTPSSIDIHGSYPGPRGIHVGETFDHVMSLFPQHSDWHKNGEGVFYGPTNYPDKPYNVGPRGSVAAYGNGITAITLSTGHEPFLRIFVKDGIVTNFTFYLIVST